MQSSVYAESEILLRGSIHERGAFARPALPQLQKNHRLEAGKYFKLMFSASISNNKRIKTKMKKTAKGSE